MGLDRLGYGVALMAAALAFAGCSDKAIVNAGGGGDDRCGQNGAGGCGGSASSDDTPPTTTASPPGGYVCGADGNVTVTLSVDEPATIFYTLDGSEPTNISAAGINQVVVDVADGELRFFAIDAEGNEEEPKSETYVRDGVPPGPVSDLTAAMANGDVTLEWQNPADDDLAGVIVLASDSPSSESLVSCTEYEVGDVVGGAKVVYVGSGSSAKFPSVRGWVTYHVHPYDAAGNIGEGTRSTPVLDIAPPGPQTATIEVAGPASTPAATVKKQADDTKLAVDASYADDVLTVRVEVTNEDTGIALLSPKLKLTSTGQGSAVNPEGTFQGASYWRPTDRGRGIGPRDTATFEVRLSEITGDVDPLVIEVELTHSPTLVFGRNQDGSYGGLGLVDTDTLSLTGAFNCVKHGYNKNGRCGGAAMVLTPDNRRVIVGSRKHQILHVFDAARRALIETVGLSATDTPDDGSAQALVGDWARGRLLAAVSHRCTRGYNRAALGGVELVSLDAITFEEVQRAVIDTAGTLALGMDISPDGKTIAVLASQSNYDMDSVSRLYFLDAETLAPLQSPENPVDLASETGLVEHRSVVFTSNTTAIVTGRRKARFYRIDLANGFALTQVTTGAPDSSIGPARVAPDGSVWIPHHQNIGFTRIASGGASGDYHNVFKHISAVAFHPNGQLAFLTGRSGNTMYVVDPANPTSEIATIPLGFSARAHLGAVSSF